jgi:hypothetical protein
MVKANNPAGRLYDVLSNAKKHPPTQSEQSKKVWGSVLGVNPDSTLLIKRLVQLMEELDDTIGRLKKLENFTLALHEPQLRAIWHALSPTLLNAHWEHVVHLLSDSSMISLASAADWLAHHDPDGEINAKELSSLQNEIEELVKEILGSELDATFREFVLEQLEKIRSAILEYRLRGPAALREALESTTGAIFLNRALIKKEAVKEGGTVWKQFERVISTTHTLIVTIAKFHQLAEPLIRLLPR